MTHVFSRNCLGGASVLASFAFIFLFDWMFHGVVMKEIYEQTPQLWRTAEEMQSKFHWLVLGQFLLALFVTKVFLHGYENKGLKEGFRFGFLIGLLLSIPCNFIMYAVAPYTEKLVGYWMMGGLVEMSCVGLVLALIYRPPSSL